MRLQNTTNYYFVQVGLTNSSTQRYPVTCFSSAMQDRLSWCRFYRPCLLDAVLPLLDAELSYAAYLTCNALLQYPNKNTIAGKSCTVGAHSGLDEIPALIPGRITRTGSLKSLTSVSESPLQTFRYLCGKVCRCSHAGGL